MCIAAGCVAKSVKRHTYIQRNFGYMLNEMIDIIGIPLDLGGGELGLKLRPDAFREAELLWGLLFRGGLGFWTKKG